MSKSRLITKRPDNKELHNCMHPLEPGEGVDLHWHDHYELEIIIEGSGVHQCNGKTTLLQRGDAYLVTYYDFHTITANEHMEILHFSFPESVVPDALNTYIATHSGNLQCHFSDEQTEYFMQQRMSLQTAVCDKLLFSDVNLRFLVYEILISIIRNSTTKAEKSPKQMQRAVAYINKHFEKSLTLAELATKLELSPNYCGNLFTKTIGTTFNKYLLQVRLRNACRLLATTDTPLAEIAQKCGFNTAEYFFLSFKKTLGITPSAYRAKEKNA